MARRAGRMRRGDVAAENPARSTRVRPESFVRHLDRDLRLLALGGLLYRAAYPLPFVFAIGVAAVLLVALLASWRRHSGSDRRGSGREAAQARH